MMMMNNIGEKEATGVHTGPENSGPLDRANLEQGTSNSVRGQRVVWAAWWAGTTLIVLSWFGVVSNVVGWIGFAGALAASFVSVMVSKYWRMPK